MNYALKTMIDSMRDYADAIENEINYRDRVIDNLDFENKELKVSLESRDTWHPYPDEVPKMNDNFLVTYQTENHSGNTLYEVADAYWTGVKWNKDFEEFNGVIAFRKKPSPYIPKKKD